MISSPSNQMGKIMLCEINSSCAAVMAHSVWSVCDCVDTPYWAQDHTTALRASLPTSVLMCSLISI